VQPGDGDRRARASRGTYVVRSSVRDRNRSSSGD
jgi:hypothetical protein